MTDGPIDPAVLSELQETMGEDFASELVATFLDEGPTMLAELQEAIARGDADGFRRAAHSVKSNANVFGATALAELARRLELAGLSDNAQSDRAAATELEAEFGRAAAALKGA